jgi:hypothetical protein
MLPSRGSQQTTNSARNTFVSWVDFRRLDHLEYGLEFRMSTMMYYHTARTVESPTSGCNTAVVDASDSQNYVDVGDEKFMGRT